MVDRYIILDTTVTLTAQADFDLIDFPSLLVPSQFGNL